jgi:mevalonate kinase
MERIGIGHSKLILFGEHAAVYGFPALGVTLPDSLEVRVSGEYPDWRFPGMAEEDAGKLRGFIASLSRIIPLTAREGGEIRISSTVPRSVGFGSSAALCAAMAAAFAPESATREEIWSIAHQAEQFFHGAPSGIDTGLSLLHGLFAFSPAPPGLPSARRVRGFPFHLVIGAVPRRASTADLVSGLRNRMSAGEVAVRALIEELGGTANRAIELFDGFAADLMSVSQATTRLGDLMNAAHAALRKLGLNDESVEKLIEAGMNMGAAGGKLSGAGGGGAFSLLYPSVGQAEEAARRLSALAGRKGIPCAAPIAALHWAPPQS